MEKSRSTTVVVVRKDGVTCMGSDGQVTLGVGVIKHTAKKVRKIYHGQVLVGFAGTAADGLALLERLEKKLEELRGNLTRAVVELAKEWRMDKALRRLEAVLLVADKSHIYLASGMGDVIEPDEPILAIGSGGNYALAAARALYRNNPQMSARQIVEEALKIASEICIYTNDKFTIEEL
ncbi:MAG TPA: ATP-dependent protease subunit HslV [Aquifex aeolicus]|uniref:ATP-dependent protease subunit HslV n=1 Tax=Aquifex aeolicus TaxID=63363 RepID=A0A9D0YQY4_AQUAO|nr:ATP-dependent protease subunit HslV [Aquificales bacterium]HIP98555.1 ATP-dependent protease subunit HslV [Aquifex aeolicus]HIQ26423.1 ATP-dependent protease subunit HslV [Aquifex aeolicus]